MIFDAVLLLAGTYAVLHGVYQLFDARRYLRHSGPWTRRLRGGILELLGVALVVIGQQSEVVAWPVLFAIMVVTVAPGLAAKDAVEHAALKPPRAVDFDPDRRRIE